MSPEQPFDAERLQRVANRLGTAYHELCVAEDLSVPDALTVLGMFLENSLVSWHRVLVPAGDGAGVDALVTLVVGNVQAGVRQRVQRQAEGGQG
jgi:hypothetical protein